jgi:PKD repeat protein
MRKLFLLSILTAGMLGLNSCKDDEPKLGEAPTQADALFTYEPSATNPNIIKFEAKNKTLTAKWDFGNGTNGEGSLAEASYPNKGSYTVTLTVFNSGGSASTSQTITIDQDDPTLLSDPLYTLLTGGASGKGYKTWVMDSTRDVHFGVGPNPSSASAGNYPEWYAAKRLEKAGAGLYNDQYVFRLQGFGFDMKTGGDVYLNTKQAANFAGSAQTNVGDYRAPYDDQLNEKWTLTMGEKDTTLTVSGKSYIGYITGVQTYKIVRISENELFLRYEDAADPALAWYIRLVPDDYPINGGGGGGGTDPTFALPLDFESTEPTFNTFGGSTYSFVANPSKTGINTSNKVLETVHGNETWAGIYVNISSKFNFSTKKTITLKVWSPVTGDFRIKLENSALTTQLIEKDVTITKANEWVEISVDFSDATADLYDRLVLFPGWGVANAGTFYLDDISQQ